MLRGVRFGPRDIQFPSTELGVLRDANDLLDDAAALRDRMAEDGYLLLRQMIAPEAVAGARKAILQHMDEQQALRPGMPVLEGVMRAGKTVPMLGRKGITHAPPVRNVFEHRALFDFYSRYFDEPATTFDYKWLRGVGNEEYTGAHFDVVYMGRGSGRLLTCWIPLGEVPVEHGTLAVCVGSHNSARFERLRQTYGKMDVDRDHVTEGSFTSDPMEIAEKFGGQWATTDFHPGDILTFGMFTMHASTTNLTNRFRLSCDVRFQPAADPVDERWVGENPIGHYGWHAAPTAAVSIAEAREKWGV